MKLTRRSLLAKLSGLAALLTVTPAIAGVSRPVDRAKFAVGDTVLVKETSFIAQVYNNSKPFLAKIEDIGNGKYFGGGYWVSRLDHKDRTSKPGYLCYPGELEKVEWGFISGSPKKGMG